MKVKIGNRIYDSKDQPIMVIFDKGEKELISHMKPDDMKFCAFPILSTVSEIEAFMGIEDENQLSMVIENGTIFVPGYSGEWI